MLLHLYPITTTIHSQIVAFDEYLFIQVQNNNQSAKLSLRETPQ
jgi:hypothetical protein